MPEKKLATVTATRNKGNAIYRYSVLHGRMNRGESGTEINGDVLFSKTSTAIGFTSKVFSLDFVSISLIQVF